MRVLFSTDTSPRKPLPHFGGDQVNCGPLFQNREVGGRYLSLAATDQNYDLVKVADRLPYEQAPDVVVCLASATGTHRPRNLAAFRCPKFLIVGKLSPGDEALADLGRYARSESFDRVVVTDDWRTWAALARAGLRGLHWQPGLAFPGRDSAVRNSGRAGRANRVALSVEDPFQEELPRVLRLAAPLAASGLPVAVHSAGFADTLKFYGESLIGLASADGGETGQNPLSILAAGALLITDRPTPESGPAELWIEGREIVTFAAPEELGERVRYYLAHPDEAKALGEAGRRWFWEHCGEKRRQALFRQLAFGDMPAPGPQAVAPRSLETLAGEGGLQGPTPTSAAVAARKLWRQGDLPRAFAAAKQILAGDPQSAEGAQLMAVLAAEAGNGDLHRKLAADARRRAPGDPRNLLLEMYLDSKVMRRRDAVETAWTAFEAKREGEANARVDALLQAGSESADLYRLHALLRAEHARQEKSFYASLLRGQCLEAWRRATELAPRDADLWRDAAMALRDSGLLPEAVTAYRRALQLEPADALAWFGLGEACLVLGRAEAATEAFTSGLGIEPEDSQLQFWLGYACKQRGRLTEAQLWHQRAVGAPQAAPATVGRRRRAVFVVQHAPMWTSTASIYAAFQADPSWEAIVVAVPYLIPAFKDRYDQTMAIFDFLHSEGIPHVRWDEFELPSDFADVVFLPNPYDYSRPPGWKTLDLLKRVPRLAYVSYALEIGGGRENARMLCDQFLQRAAWRVFARSEHQRKAFLRHCASGAGHVVVTGHPRSDAIGELAAVHDPELEGFRNGRKLIFWNPHVDVRIGSTPFGHGFSTFLRWREFLVEEFKRRPDMAFVVRPHPQLFAKLIEYRIISQKGIDDFLATCAAAGNIQIDLRPSYLPVFACSSALLSDASTFLLEYAGTGKPLLYLHNPDGPGLNGDGAFVREHCATAETEAEIVRFLDEVAAGRDRLKPGRMAAYADFMHQPPGGVGRAIKWEIETALAAECALPPALAAETQNPGLTEAAPAELAGISA